MPVTYSIDPARNLIRTACAGPVKLEEVLDHFRTLREDPACTGQLDVLLNVSEAQLLPQSGQLGSVSAELGAIGDKVQFGMCAIVAAGDAMFGMMRIFEVFAGRFFRAIRVFRGQAAAEAWLSSRQEAWDTESGANPPKS